ncbi:hypothetical protein B7494_g516 [Chlorociboria aeruginascens]|nr:hypothetical protein B7494_g516 [Chlorociboria aeruginascens]
MSSPPSLPLPNPTETSPLIDPESQIGTSPLQPQEVSKDPLSSGTPSSPSSARATIKFLFWTTINLLGTIGIVFTNKAIFNDPSFTFMQTSFACFHFLCTGLTLWVVSRAWIGVFVPKRAKVVDLLPLAFAMCLNVVLPNVSLAFSTVTVYQLCRVLLTPVTAIINYVFYSATIPRSAIVALIPVCAGVGITTYFDTKPSKGVETTSLIGIGFALAGVCASAVYVVLIGVSHRKLDMSSSQLLLNQAPISSIMLLLAIPLADRIPVLSEVPYQRWLMILMSAGFAIVLNISQFFIVASTGPVSSTIFGHLKTISIVSIGWVVSGRSVADNSLYGIVLTIGGIIIYSYIMLTQSR